MIFITGGTGILGSHLLFELTKTEDSLRAIFRSEKRLDQVKQLFQFYSPSNWEEQFSKIDWVQGDLLDISSLSESMKGCTRVYHCAALVSFHKKDFNDLIKINREGTGNIVNLCLSQGIEKLCFVSSTAAIGGESRLITEDTKWKNSPDTSGYAISKYNAEREVWRGIEEGLNAVIVNPCVILGPGNWNESSLTIFKTLQKGLRHYPPGANATVDARDVSEIMIRLMNSSISGERYLCIGSNQSFKNLMTCIANELKVKAPSKKVGKFTVNLVRYLISIANGIVGKRSSVTRETIVNLFSTKEYNNDKIKQALDFEFRSLKEQVRNAVKGRIS